MKMKFGVSSATPINKKLKNGYTMYEWVMRQKGVPAFCMRTLDGDGKLTAEEMAFLRDKDCKIGLVIRDLAQVYRPAGSMGALLPLCAGTGGHQPLVLRDNYL